jgi:hypothetical protein
MRRSIIASNTGAIENKSYASAMQGNIEKELIEGAVKESRVDGNNWPALCSRT